MPPKVATRSSLENVLILDEMLSAPGGSTIDQMCGRLGCCQKTVRRHLSWMARMFGSRFTRSIAAGPERWFYADGDMAIFTNQIRRRFR